MNKGYITNSITHDGFGARMHRVIQTIGVTFYLRDTFGVNLEYIHTPFTYEGFGLNYEMYEQNRINCGEHPYYEGKREGYIKRGVLWDNQIAYNGMKITDIELDDVEIIKDKNTLWYDVKTNFVQNKLYILEKLHNEFNSGFFDINIVDKYYSEIISYFDFNTDMRDSIILHIRRKDAMLEDIRQLNDEYYLDILKALIPYKNDVTIHTQRQGFDSNKYNGWKIIYDDEEEDFNLFVEMIKAKTLIIGKSSFSYAAGLLNQNVVIYPQQNIESLNRWINKEEYIKSLK